MTAVRRDHILYTIILYIRWYPIRRNFVRGRNNPSIFHEYLGKFTSLIVCEFEDNILNFRNVMIFLCRNISLICKLAFVLSNNFEANQSIYKVLSFSTIFFENTSMSSMPKQRSWWLCNTRVKYRKNIYFDMSQIKWQNSVRDDYVTHV